MLDAVLAGLNYKNLDEHPDFAGKLSTTEALAQYIADAVAAQIRVGSGRARTGRPGRHPARDPGRLGQLLARLRRQLGTAVPPPSPRIRLVVPGNVRHNSGGNVYNAALARELAASGAEVETCPLDGGWPVGSAEDRRRLAALLRAPAGGADRAAESPGDVTSWTGCSPAGRRTSWKRPPPPGRPVWILLHMPLDRHPELERRALQAAAGVICTSSSAAAGIRARHGLDRVRVALPGHRRRPRWPRARSAPHLIAVAALLPNKDQSLLLAALARLTDLPWTASLLGSDTADPGYAARLRDTVERLGLPDRIAIPGRAARCRAGSRMGCGRPQPAHFPGRDLRPGGHRIARPRHPGGGARGHRRRRSARRRQPSGGRRRATPAETGARCRAPPSHSRRTRPRWPTCCAAGSPIPGSGRAGGTPPWPRGTGCPAGTPRPGPCWRSSERTLPDRQARPGSFRWRTSCWRMSP